MAFEFEMDSELLEETKNEQNSQVEEQTTKKTNKNKRICKYCKKSLKSIGTSRKGGSDRFYDSDYRQYHIKCLKQHTEDERRQEIINQMLINSTMYDSLLENLGKSRW